MIGQRKGGCDDGNQSTGVCRGGIDDLCLLATASKDMEVQVCGGCIARYVGDILNRRLPLVSVRVDSAILADHCDQFHHVAYDGGNPSAQITFSS